MRPSVKVRTPSIDRAYKKYTNISKSVVFQASTLLRNEIITSMQQSPATGRIYTRGGITHQASSGGNPPRVDTGALISSISTKQNRAGLSIEVGTSIDYAPLLEFGTSKMAARPFLHPAAQVVKGKIKALIKRAIG